MNKKVIICVIIAVIAIAYNKVCKAEPINPSVKLTHEGVKDINKAYANLHSVDWYELDKQAVELIERADDMLCRLEERIARIEKFQKEHGHK